MRVLLVHPEDSPRRGPWSHQRWDLLVDLGKSSPFSSEAWSQQYGCPVLRADSFRQGIADVKLVRETFSAGRGRVIDEEGIDWWDLTSLLLVPEALAVLAFQRIAAEIDGASELWATRPQGPARLLAILLGREPRTFGEGGLAWSAARAMRYAGLAQRFTAAQIKEIFLDKYDADYRWRSRFAARQPRCVEPVVLLPSAYGNASRMAAAYARLLPQQKFLMVATRQNAKQVVAPANVIVRDLAAYAKVDLPTAEITSLRERWMQLKVELSRLPELQVLFRAGELDPFSDWIRDGIIARNAWRQVIEREPVCGVLCGDDSNRYTRLPVLLAAGRNIPTVDFHHGAFDGRYLLKDLPCEVYLAKSEMERDYLVQICGLSSERIVIGAPFQGNLRSLSEEPPQKRSAIFFSEPYEVVGMRAEEVYRELLPALCRAARENGRGVIIKLHPFESRSQRRDIVRDILDPIDRELVTVVAGPLTDVLLSQAWFGMTVESTTVMDCLQNGIQCFLCEWLALSPYEYLQQYARFGVGEVLQNVEQVGSIPKRLEDFRARSSKRSPHSTAIDPAMLHRWLTSGLHERTAPRQVS